MNHISTCKPSSILLVDLAGVPNACDNLIRRAAKRAGLSTKVSGHDLRRTFGRVAYRAGMDLTDLKNIYGHKSVEMTAHYIGVEEDWQRRGLDKFERAISSQPMSIEERF